MARALPAPLSRVAQRWAVLPRDARDTLFLLGVIAWTVLPHAPHLPGWTLVLCLALLGWRAALALRQAPLPRRRVVAGVLVITMGLTWLSLGTLVGQNAGVTLLVVLMALKTLELRARRDALVVFFLGFFLVLTHFLFSQSLAVAVAMVGSVWGLLTALTLAHMPNGRPAVADAGRVAGRAALLGAPVMVLLFLLFPRLGPLWSAPSDHLGRTGLSDQLRMGALAEIANDDSIAMRVRFDGPAPPPQAMYFRGPVLSRFDGQQWRAATPPRWIAVSPRVDEPAPLDGPGLRYEVTLEATQATWLPLLEMTPDVPGAAPRIDGHVVRAQTALQWRTERPVHARVRFSATAWPGATLGPRRDQIWLRDDVELPSGYNPRALAWAALLRSRPEYAQASAPVVVLALLRHIRSDGFTYTLAPGEYGRDAVDEFWFDRKRGFCEHFATSMVVMLRAMDVPARVVTGYQGADPLVVDGWHVVRERHAHAWAEYWTPGAGWVRVDPTAAVAPDRIERSSPLPLNRGLVGQALSDWSPEALVQLRLGWEALNNRWNQWVLDYSSQRQFELLRRLGVNSPDWSDLALALAVAAALAGGAGAGWLALERWRRDPWLRLRERIARRLQALQVPATPSDPPRRLAAQVAQHLGERGETLAALLLELERLRYGRDAVTQPPRPWERRFDAACRAAAGR